MCRNYPVELRCSNSACDVPWRLNPPAMSADEEAQLRKEVRCADASCRAVVAEATPATCRRRCDVCARALVLALRESRLRESLVARMEEAHGERVAQELDDGAGDAGGDGMVAALPGKKGSHKRRMAAERDFARVERLVRFYAVKRTESALRWLADNKGPVETAEA